MLLLEAQVRSGQDISLNEMMNRKDVYKHGVKRLYLYHKSDFDLFFVSPGSFYFGSRSFNEFGIEKGFDYVYTIREA